MFQQTRDTKKYIRRSIVIWGGLLALLFFLMPSMQVEASDTITENNITYTLDSTTTTATVSNGKLATGQIEIPSIVKVGDTNYMVTTIDTEAFYRSTITSVTIPSSVTSIGNNAFFWCENLTEATIEAAIPIGENTFRTCTKLVTISMEQVTSIGVNAFKHTGLTSVTIPASVTSIERFAFEYSNDLTTVIIEGEPIIDEDAFTRCTKLTTIHVTSESMKARIEELGLNGVNVVNISAKDTTTNTSDTTSTADATTTYIPPAWVPTDPADIYRHSLMGLEDPSIQVLSSVDSIRMVKEVQGQLFFDAVALVQGDYTLARTYNLFVNNTLTYYNGNSAKIELQIPEVLQANGRTFAMYGVTEEGKAYSCKDLDSDPTTITFETDRFYAFVLGYLDS